MLAALGEDTARDGIVDTPKRVAKAMAFAVRGYGMSAVHHVGRAAPGMPPPPQNPPSQRIGQPTQLNPTQPRSNCTPPVVASLKPVARYPSPFYVNTSPRSCSS